MSDKIFPALAVLPIGFGAAWLIVRLMREIPRRIEERWRLEIEEHMNVFERGLHLPALSLSTKEKAAIFLLAPALAAAWVYWRGLNVDSLVMCLYFFAMLLLVGINLKHRLLPDMVVLPMLWLGLMQHAYAGNSSDVVIGAALGYLLPFTLLMFVREHAGKNVLGYGDLKCFAMAGAWFGAAALPTLFIVFFAAVIGLAILAKLTRFQLSLPSGPAHLAASAALSAGVHFF